MKNKWFSYYIYYNNEYKKDKLIIEINNIMSNLLEKELIKKWFFIRYWEGGPNIRLRFYTNDSLKENVITQFKIISEFICDNPSDKPFNREEFQNSVKNFMSKNEKFYWHNDGEIISAKYLPEYDRYGGKNLMSFNESFFQISSMLVSSLIKYCKNFYIKILIGHIICSKIINEQPVDCKIFNNCLYGNISFWHSKNINPSENINKFLKSNSKGEEIIINKLFNDNIVRKNISQFILYTKSLYEKNLLSDEYYSYVIISHLHMFNNRLGCPPLIEVSYYKEILQTNK